VFEHNQTFGISYALHMLLKLGTLYHSRPHYGILWEASFPASEKNYHLV